MNGVNKKGADLSIRVHGKPENETRMLYLEEVHTKGANINLMVEHQGIVFLSDNPREQITSKSFQVKRNQFLRLFLFLNAK